MYVFAIFNFVFLFMLETTLHTLHSKHYSHSIVNIYIHLVNEAEINECRCLNFIQGVCLLSVFKKVMTATWGYYYT